MRTYYVYILTNRSGTLYTGITSSLSRRVFQHIAGTSGSFTKRYRIHRLIYAEAYATALEAIAREKQIKSWRRKKKLALIRAGNPRFSDLSDALA